MAELLRGQKSSRGGPRASLQLGFGVAQLGASPEPVWDDDEESVWLPKIAFDPESSAGPYLGTLRRSATAGTHFHLP